MSVIFQKWLPRQKAWIEKVRLDINPFVLNNQWSTHLREADLESLPSLKIIYIITHACPERDPFTERMQQRRSRLVEIIYEMLANRPFLTMYVVRDQRPFRRLTSESKLEDLLELV